MDLKKITSYVTLIIGMIIILIVFFLQEDGFDFTTRLRETYFYNSFHNTGDFSTKLTKLIWWVLLFSFAYSWWSLRDCIRSILLKIHRRV